MASKPNTTHHVANPRNDLSPLYLRSKFDCDPEAGLLFHKSGKRAGCFHRSGYRHVKIDQVSYKEHRVLWALVYGEWPEGQIDHINGDKADNRITNLRDVGGTQNQINIDGPNSNNRSGYRGVSTTRWGYVAELQVRGKRNYLGLFSTPEDAANAYQRAKAALRHPRNE